MSAERSMWAKALWIYLSDYNRDYNAAARKMDGIPEAVLDDARIYFRSRYFRSVVAGGAGIEINARKLLDLIALPTSEFDARFKQMEEAAE